MNQVSFALIVMARGKESGSETAEVTNGFWSCRDITDIVPLYTPISLYLKPTAKVNVSVSLPQLKTPGNTLFYNLFYLVST